MAKIEVLVPLGVCLLFQRHRSQTRRLAVRLPEPVLVAVAGVVGYVGGIYGIGGGSILAAILIGTGRPAAEVAPTTLATTFLTSVVGVVAFLILSVGHSGSLAPDWGTGIASGIGGLLGGYIGARLQPHLAETVICRLVGRPVAAIVRGYSVVPTSSRSLRNVFGRSE